MKTIPIQGKYLVPMDSQTNIDLRLSAGRVALISTQPPNPEPVDVNAFLARVRALEQEINHQLTDLQEVVRVCLVALLCGGNVYLHSLPGAAKSTLARLIGEGIDGRFFRILLNPDVTRNDLLGSLDPKAIQQGTWARRPAGAMVADAALFDEFWKGSGAVRNMVLDLLEEHRVSTPDGDLIVPLLIGFAASNEIIEPNEKNAVFDRFLFRVILSYPKRGEDWARMVTGASGRATIQTRLAKEEILLVQALVEIQAQQLPAEMAQAMVTIKAAMDKQALRFSPRRFLGWARAAVASAMLSGEPLSVRHLAIGQHILWIAPDTVDTVRNIVTGISDPSRGILLAAQADLEEVRGELERASSYQEIAQLHARVKKIGKTLERVTGAEYRETIDGLKGAIQETFSAVIERANSFSQNP